MKVSKLSVHAVLSAAALATACIVSSTSVVYAAGQVVLYSANDDTVNNLIAEGFKKETGISVNVVATGPGVLFRRIASEHEHPQSDVIWGVSATLLRQNSKYFEPYASPERNAVPANFRDPDNMRIGTNLQVVVLSQNTQSIPAASGPTSWNDLIDPKWKGKIAYTDPANSGFSYAIATALIGEWGDNKAAWDKFSHLVANTRVLNRSTLVYSGNGSGEYPLGISLEYAGYLWAHNGAPVKVTYPTDGTIALVEDAAMIKGGPNPDNAKKLIDYITSKSTQEALFKTTFRRPARQDVDFSVVSGIMPPCRRSSCCHTTTPNGMLPAVKHSSS